MGNIKDFEKKVNNYKGYMGGFEDFYKMGGDKLNAFNVAFNKMTAQNSTIDDLINNLDLIIEYINIKIDESKDKKGNKKLESIKSIAETKKHDILKEARIQDMDDELEEALLQKKLQEDLEKLKIDNIEDEKTRKTAQIEWDYKKKKEELEYRFADDKMKEEYFNELDKQKNKKIEKINKEENQLEEKLHRIRIENIEDEQKRKIELVEYDYNKKIKTTKESNDDENLKEAYITELIIQKNRKIEGIKKEYEAINELAKAQTTELNVQNKLTEDFSNELTGLSKGFAYGITSAIFPMKQTNALAEQLLNTMIQLTIKTAMLKGINLLFSGGLASIFEPTKVAGIALPTADQKNNVIKLQIPNVEFKQNGYELRGVIKKIEKNINKYQ